MDFQRRFLSILDREQTIKIKKEFSSMNKTLFLFIPFYYKKIK